MKRVVLKVARGHSLPFKSVKFSGGFGKCFNFTKQVKIWAEVSETISKVRGDNRILFLWWFIRWPQILFSFFHTYKCSKRTKTWGGGRVGGKWGRWRNVSPPDGCRSCLQPNQFTFHATAGQQPLVKRIITAPPHPWPSSSSTRSKSLDFWFRSFDTVYNLLLSPSPSPTDIYFPSFSLSDNQIQSHDDPLDAIHALSNSRQITQCTSSAFSPCSCNTFTLPYKSTIENPGPTKKWLYTPPLWRKKNVPHSPPKSCDVIWDRLLHMIGGSRHKFPENSQPFFSAVPAPHLPDFLPEKRFPQSLQLWGEFIT